MEQNITKRRYETYQVKMLSYKHSELSMLEQCDNKTPKWDFDGMTVLAKCISVYDGDTATFAFIPYPEGTPKRFSCRFLGYNSTEFRTKDEEEKR